MNENKENRDKNTPEPQFFESRVIQSQNNYQKKLFLRRGQRAIFSLLLSRINFPLQIKVRAVFPPKLFLGFDGEKSLTEKQFSKTVIIKREEVPFYISSLQIEVLALSSGNVSIEV